MGDLFPSAREPAGGPAAEGPSLYVEVAVPVPLRSTFHYRLPPSVGDGSLAPGTRLKVPFGRRSLTGYLVGHSTEEEALRAAGGAGRIRDVASVVDGEPLVTQELLRLAVWMAGYYRAGLGEVLAAMLPAGVRKGMKPETRRLVRALRPRAEMLEEAARRRRRAPRQAVLLDTLAQIVRPVEASLLLAEADAGVGALEALSRDGLVEVLTERAEESPSVRARASAAPLSAGRTRLELTEEQSSALAAMIKSLDSGFSVHLLHGVTGSGKTELYLRLMEEVLRRGKGAIVLVPEIALTPQTLERFSERFGDVAVLHSHLTEGTRAEEWRAVRLGRLRIAIGARSAVFAPVEPLGLIVIDEEHEGSFKQESSPRYHARDVAVMRASLAGATVVLGSATPSLESYRNAVGGKYSHLILPKRVEKRPLPEVEVVDMSVERADAKRFVRLSRRLIMLTEQTLSRGEQAIYFINRRGFATFLTCPRCGWTAKCPDCAVTVVYHKKRNALVCHYCGRDQAAPRDCPDCLFHDVPYWGFGSERIEEEIRERFGGVECARMDSDTMTDRRAYEKTLGRFRSGEVRILVGTQMIAKGLDFPDVTLVGVVNADVAVNLPDFRASERTFQLLAQVAGRTGRGEKGGRVVIQTTVPDHPAVAAARSHGYEEFARREMESRRRLFYPPFSRLARVVLSGKEQPAVRLRAGQVARALAKSIAETAGGCVLMGPAEAPLAVIGGRHRWHIIVKAPESRALAAVLDGADEELTKRSGVQATVDVDPVAML